MLSARLAEGKKVKVSGAHPLVETAHEFLAYIKDPQVLEIFLHQPGVTHLKERQDGKLDHELRAYLNELGRCMLCLRDLELIAVKRIR